MTPRKWNPATGTSATDNISDPSGKPHCVHTYSLGNEHPWSPSQYPNASWNKYSWPLTYTLPWTKCRMLCTLCRHSRKGSTENGPIISYFKGKIGPKCNFPFIFNSGVCIAKRIPLFPKRFCPIRISSPVRWNAATGKSTFHEWCSVMIWMEQNFFCSDLWTAGITASVWVADWHLKYHP